MARPPIPKPPAPTEFQLNGITVGDFQGWKHHPVTKVLFRFLMDREQQMAERMVAQIRTSGLALTEFEQGVFQGRINELAELSAIEFENLVEFYPVADEQEG